MAGRWLNLFLRFSGLIFGLKRKMVQSPKWPAIFFYAVLLVILEIIFVFISLPLYFAVSPKKLQERGLVFPATEHEGARLKLYAVRRKISLAAIFAAGGIFVIKLIFVGVVSSYLLGAQALLAATQDWTFDVAGDYTYDSAKIEVTGGVAQLKATNTVYSGATTNPNFTTNAVGWTYADWDQDGGEANVAGARQTSGGNTGGWIRIRVPSGSSDQLGGYYRQGFSTTVANPAATVSFDWQVSDYDSTPNPFTFKLYVFVDTGTGDPVIGQEVWSSPSITSASGWASVSNLDVSSKVTSVGTYYLKVAVWLETAASSGGPYSVGYDNIQLDWTKTVAGYDSSGPSIYPVNSLAPAGVTSWTSFTETATKNGGSINYQLSSNNGTTWRYWNGSVWAGASTSADANSATVINTNLSSFSTAFGQIKWRAFLVGDGSQQVILDNISIGYTTNSPPAVQNLTVSQNTANGYAFVNFSLADQDSDLISLVNYEYSLTGAFTGEQAIMTASSTDPAHSGITSLTSSPTGAAHIFVWNALADVGSVYTTAYVRLRANDGIVRSAFATSTAVTLDYVAPVVSSVSAVQPLGGTAVQITYNLSDNTADNILVELEISEDSGATWTVPATAIAGDTGAAVTAGSGKTITWQAATDFGGQAQSDMRVRIRARDKYQNQGVYVLSADFSLDTLPPSVAVQADLLAQPLSGAITALIGGSFTESNPNTNDFYVAVDGGSYGAATAGDSNTAAPSDLSAAVGSTLKGNNYISAVKIVHTDDYGQSITNENTSPSTVYKYVKPYTPPAPAIDNPAADGVDVTISKNAAEADGLEYAIFESSQSKYVQSDGTLGTSPVWQILGVNPGEWGSGTAVAGKVAVTGLAQPISQYIFKVKSRNPADEAHAAASESQLSSGAASSYQSPNVVINSAAQITDGTKYVVINYTGTDYQNQTNSLASYEYSTDNNIWHAMTEKAGVGSSGVSGLAFASGGTALVFTWDVNADLPGIHDSAVYVRLVSSDTVTNSNTAVSAAFTVNTVGPVIANITASQTAGTGNIAIGYDLVDGAGFNNTVEMLVSGDSGATYTVAAPNVSGDIGSGITSGVGRAIVWNAAVDFPGQETSAMRVKIRATDRFGNVSNFTESGDFALDTKGPVLNGVTASQSSSSALVTVNYILSDFSSTSTVEFNVSADDGVTWTVPTSTFSGNMGANQTAGAKTFVWDAGADFSGQEASNMKVRVRAADFFGNLGDFVSSVAFSLDTKAPVLSDVSASQTVGARDAVINYGLTESSAVSTITLDISSDGGTAWTVATGTLTGDVGQSIASGLSKSIAWNAGADFNNQEVNNMRVRARAVDSFGNDSGFIASNDFFVDTAAPLGLVSLSKFSSTPTTVTLHWSAGVTDAHFNHYELWYGGSETDVQNRSGAALRWSAAQDAALSDINTVATVVTGIDIHSNTFVKIWAVDDYGNAATTAGLNIFEPLSPAAEENLGSGGRWVPPPAPLVKPIITPVSSPTNTSKVTVAGLANPDVSIDLYDKDGLVGRLASPADSGGDFSQNFIFSEGNHILTARAVDIANNFSDFSDPVNLTVDLTSPSAPIIFSPNDGASIGTPPRLLGAAEPLTKLEIILDGGQSFNVFSDGNGAWNFILPDQVLWPVGLHEFIIKATDLAGNAGPKTALKIRRPEPPITVVPLSAAQAPASPPAAVPAPSEVVPPVVLPSASPAPRVVSRPSIPAAPGPAATIKEAAIARELAALPSPAIVSTGPVVAGNIIRFSGTALPDEDVIVYIHSDQAAIYRTRSDSRGNWSVDHSQAELELSPGEHSVFAVTLDSAAGIKSRPSPVSTFVITKNFWVNIYNHLNLPTTIITASILFLAVLWLYRVRSGERAAIFL